MNTQPLYRILLDGKDVTDKVHGDVHLVQNEAFLTELHFKLKGGISMFSQPTENSDISPVRGKSVEFWGGTTDLTKLMFKGGATFVYLDLEPSGLSFARFECFSGGYKSKTKNGQPEVFPSSQATRGWARGKSELTVEAIVRGLITDMGCSVGEINIDKTLNRTYTLKKQLTQLESDWGLLIKLASNSNCGVFEELIDDKVKISFIDRNVLNDREGDVSFVFLGRDDEPFFWREGNLNLGIRELKEGDIQLMSCSVIEDFHVPLARRIPKFDAKTGAEYELFSFYDTKTGKWKYYELVPAKVEEYLNKGIAANESIWGVLSSTDSDRMDFDTVKNTFFQEYEYKQGNDMSNRYFPNADPPYPPRKANAVCAGNLSIKAWKSYPIYGISRFYSSDGVKNRKWYMLSCRHVWGSSGYICEMDFHQF